MKNIPLLVWFIFYYAIFSKSLIMLHARSAGTSLEILVECLDRSNITIAELIRLRGSPEERIKFINEDGDFRRYGCFFACVLKHRGAMTGTAIDTHMIAENIGKMYDDNSDINSFLHKTVGACAINFKAIGDECNVTLAFKVCILRAMCNKF